MKVRLLLYTGLCALGLLTFMTALLMISHRDTILSFPVPAFMQACEVTSQCLPVDTRCARCCGYEAIAAAHVDAYREMSSASCRLYDEQSSHRAAVPSDAFALHARGACDCFMHDTLPMCLHGFCVLAVPPAP